MTLQVKRFVPLILILFVIGCGTDFTVANVAPDVQQQIVSPQWWLTDWVWIIDGDGERWESSYIDVGIGGVLDMRSIPLMGTAGTVAGDTQCCLIFEALDSAPPIVDRRELLFLGDVNPNDTAFNLTRLQTRLGILAPITATSFGNVVKELLTTHADPTGINGPKPLMPTNGRVYHANVGGTRLFTDEESIASTAFSRTVQVHRLDYDRIKATEDSRDELHLKIAAVWEREYGLDIRSELQKQDGDTRPATTFTEDWNCSDADSLDCDLTWTELLSSDIDIVSNAAESETRGTGNDTSARADNAVSSDDHIVTGDLTCLDNDADNKPGLTARADTAGSLTQYWARFYCGSDTRVNIRKWISGTESTILSSTGSNWAVTETCTLEVDGSDLEWIVNATSFTVTDVSLTGQLRGGIEADHSNAQTGNADVRWDNWSIADLAGDPVEPHRTEYIE